MGIGLQIIVLLKTGGPSHPYNGLGDLTKLQSPDTGTTTYTYDSAGNPRQPDRRPRGDHDLRV